MRYVMLPLRQATPGILDAAGKALDYAEDVCFSLRPGCDRDDVAEALLRCMGFEATEMIEDSGSEAGDGA